MKEDQESTLFFSVVIPTYNRLVQVQQSINSVLAQSYKRIEILVVDDGSTDGSYEKLQELYIDAPSVRLIRQENKERAAARNNGLKHAKGDYVQFLDSDDTLFPDHFQVLNSKIHGLNYPDFICTKYELFREGKSISSSMSKISEGEYDYKMFLSGNPLACNICVKRNNPALHPFVEDRKYSIKEDWMFMLQNLRNNKLYIVDTVTIRMDDHDQRSMRSDNRIIIEKTFLAEKWILENIELSKSEKQILRAHVNYFCSIHSYIDGSKKTGTQYILKAIKEQGLKSKYVVLLLKTVVGKKQIDRLKNFFSVK
ncbi:MAG: glycosyltransferase family 2 protein [Bacteroidia bacterium]|nr:glycosyltransferase family 2 protein [Bacteroidia bacterium]